MSQKYSNFEIDVNSPGGLMPQIQALIAPPSSEDPKSIKLKKEEEKRRHIYFKRPGRGHNRDSCDACHDGGELICCDKCPASFHLQCHDPPLELSDVPTGEWICHACRSALKKENNSGNKRKKKSALEVLALAASLSNPKEFGLPRELQIPITFPGTDKIDPVSYKRGRHQNSTGINGKIHYYENGSIIPLPARLCFECGRSCRKAPLIACDYCPLYFHQDCLDPPLTAFPSGRWMCPNHINHFIDQNLLKSSGATERIKLWDKFANQRIDQHAIKLQFIRKAHAVNPPFRIKLKQHQKSRVKVPLSVKFHYANPPEMDTCSLYQPSTFLYLDNNIGNKCVEEDKTDLEVMEKKKENDSKDVKTETDEVDIKDNGPTLTKSDDEGICSKDNGPVAIEPETEFTNEDFSCINDNGPISSPSEIKEVDNIDNGPVSFLSKTEEIDNDNGPIQIESETVEISSNTDLISIEEKIEIVENTVENKKNDNDNINIEKNIFIKSGLGYNIKEGISLLERPVLEILAQQRLEQILNPDGDYYQNINSTSKARALIFPLGQTIGKPVFMRGKTLNIGTGGESDLLLTQYGCCDCISLKHAVIFFDETTKKYELLNYSEFGTIVDNVLYSCNYSVHCNDMECFDIEYNGNASKYQQDQDLVYTVKKIANRNNRLDKTENSESVGIKCKCVNRNINSNKPFTEGWEGSAIIDHGSIISFGCLTYVFSTVDKFTNR